MSSPMVITSTDDSPILDFPLIRRALLHLYAPEEISDIIDVDGPIPYSWIDVEPKEDSSFGVTIEDDHSGCGIDGTFEQNARVAAALRAEIPEDAPRIVAIEPKLNSFVDLTAGITAEQIPEPWRDVSEFTMDE